MPLASLSVVVAGVGVPLAIHLCLFFGCFFFLFVDTPMWESGKSCCALGCPSFFLKPKWGGSRSWCTPGRPSFIFVVVYTPTWDSGKSCVPLAVHLFF